MGIRDIYKITIKNWDKYNKGLKPSHKKIMISTRFLDDAKIASLPQGGKLLYLGLLLACGDHTSSSVEASHERLVSLAGGTGQRVVRLLSQLESLQLVTFELLPPFRTELKGSEEKGNERKRSSAKGMRPKQDASQPPESAAPVIAHYCDSWKARYKTEKSPPIMPHNAKQIKQLVQQVGGERAKLIVEAYLKMPDSWFVTKRHDIPTMMGNLNAISQFIDTGKLFTKRDINQLDLTVTNNNTLQALRDGEV